MQVNLDLLPRGAAEGAGAPVAVSRKAFSGPRTVRNDLKVYIQALLHD